MTDYLGMNKVELNAELDALRARYQEFVKMNLKLDMSRGKPCPEQLDLSKEMLRMVDNYIGENGVDARNYGLLAGMPEARRFFAELLRVDDPEQVIVCGNSSLSMMYYLVDLGWRAGFVDSVRPWRFCNNTKFLCPVPGYDRHFRISEYFGLQMIPVPMLKTGPDMDMVEKLVKEDESIKGIWCVPVYSNPDGYVYSDETVRRLAG
ncbi:aspartate aminotransferase, partial [gut metagenome]